MTIKKSVEKTLRVSAPGSLMLSGEHAVLRDYPALVAAVDKRIFIELSPLGKNHIIIESDKFGSLVLPLEHLSLSLNNLASPFHFVGNILARFADKFINRLKNK